MKKIILILPVFIFCSSVFAQISVAVSAAKNIRLLLSGKGRLLIYFYKGHNPDPVNSIQPGNPRESGFRFGKDIEWKNQQTIVLGNEVTGFLKKSFRDLDTGTYYVQAVFDMDTTTYRLMVPPNIYSTSKKIHISKKGKETIQLFIDKEFEPVKYTDGHFTRFISIKSTLLSAFWKREVILHACVRLPPGYDSTGATKYPVNYQIGGYASSCTNFAYYGPDSNYLKPWVSSQAPPMLRVSLDSDAPYGDSYQMNSENNGPYMDALTKELIPAIEQKFHAYGTAESRFLTGGSTGGWVSLALQIFNPDFFNGCWSFFADPVDFNFFQLVNIYKDDNAYVNRYGNLNPSMRTVYGEPILSIKDEVGHENVLGRNNSYVFSGDQWGGWNAVYSPKAKDGNPAAIWDPTSGAIDSTVANYWKRWDLHQYLKEHWKELGPKLQGKIHIWMGDMDTYYLNNAMRLFQDFISKTANPKSDAQIIFGPMEVHGWQPINQFEILKQMKARFDSTAKKAF